MQALLSRRMADKVDELAHMFSRQPPTWPIWDQGWNFGEDNKRIPTTEWHLFLYEPQDAIGMPAYGRPVAACNFINGAQYVEFDSLGRIESNATTQCEKCQKVETRFLKVVFAF